MGGPAHGPARAPALLSATSGSASGMGPMSETLRLPPLSGSPLLSPLLSEQERRAATSSSEELRCAAASPSPPHTVKKLTRSSADGREFRISRVQAAVDDRVHLLRSLIWHPAIPAPPTAVRRLRMSSIGY